MGSRKRKDLLNKLGSQKIGRLLKGREEAGTGTEKTVELNKNQLEKRPTIPESLGNNKEPKRETHGSYQHNN